MLWVIIVLAACAAVGLRVLTLHGRPQVWWWSFTLALLAIVVGSALLVDEAGVNQTLGVANVAYLLSNLSYVVAGGSVTVFVHTLRREHLSSAVMGVHAAGAALVGVIITIGWLLAPVHATSYAHFRQVPPNPQSLIYDWVFHLYFLLVLANVAVCCVQLLRRTGSEDPARRVGLLLIAGASSLDLVAHLLYLTRLALQPRNASVALEIAAGADVVTLVAVSGIAAGAVAFLVVPHLLETLRARRLVTQLRPLWLRTREMQPCVVLPRPRLVRHSPTLQAERMLTEITDGLRLLALPSSAHLSDRVSDPYDAVAEALRRPPAAAGTPASRALPTPTTRLEEEEQVLTLARRYTEGLAHAS